MIGGDKYVAIGLDELDFYNTKYCSTDFDNSRRDLLLQKNNKLDKKSK